MYRKAQTVVCHFFADSAITTLSPTVTQIGDQSQQLGDEGIAEGTTLLNSYGANIPTPAPTPGDATTNQTLPTGDQLCEHRLALHQVVCANSVLASSNTGLDPAGVVWFFRE